MTTAIKFKPNKYYVVTEKNTAYEFVTLDLAKKYAGKNDVVLIALPRVTETQTADKIILNFDTKTLTVKGGDVTLNKVLYQKGETTLPEKVIQDYPTLISAVKKNSKSYQIIGNPPIEGEILK